MHKHSLVKLRRRPVRLTQVTARRARLRALLVEAWRATRHAACALVLVGGGMLGPAWAADPVIYNVASETEFNSAITSAHAGDTIRLTSSIYLSGSLNTLTQNVTIDGQGYQLSGQYDHRPFFVESGDVTIKNLTIANGWAEGGRGGAGHRGGGGGLGAGGAVFVQSGANVTLSDVKFNSNYAIGGMGGANTHADGGGGGGGYLGAGGDYMSGLPGEGGLGGGGAGGEYTQAGASGEFGGGGGGAGSYGPTDTALGGFGGGGAAGSAGGFAGGENATRGGGGAGLGGAVFVREGGTLTIVQSSGSDGSQFNGNQAIGRMGVDDIVVAQGLGAGMFLHNVQATIDVASGETMTFADSIGGYGQGGITKTGEGTLVLSGENTYTGDTHINAGRLKLEGHSPLDPSAGDVYISNATLEIADESFFPNYDREFLLAGDATIDVSHYNYTIQGGVRDDPTSGAQPGHLIKSGHGYLELGATSHTGGTSILQGGIFAYNDDALAGSDLFIDGNASLMTSAMLGVGSLSGDGAVEIYGGGLTTDSTANTAFGGSLSGNGVFVKEGSGTLNLTGDSSGFSGQTAVNAGRLAINGAINSDVTVNSSGELGGGGTIGGNVVNNGTLAVGNSIGALTVGGNATFNPGSTTVVEIRPSSTPVAGVDHDLITADSATINGGTVSVRGADGAYTHGTEYAFLHTYGPLTGAFDAINDDLAFFDAQLGYNSNYAFFRLIANSTDFASVAGSANQRSVGQAIDLNSQGANGEFGALLDEFRPMTHAQVQYSLSQLDSSVSGSGQQVGIQGTSQLFGVLSNHLRGSMSPGMGSSGFATGGLVSGASPSNMNPDSPIALASYQEGASRSTHSASGDGLGSVQRVRRLPSWMGWTTGYGLGGSARNDGNSDGIGYGLGGVTFGIEKFIDESLRVGFFGGYVGSQVTTDITNQRRSTNGGNFGTLLTQASGMHYGIAMGGFQFDGISSERNIQIGNLNATARGKTDGWQGFAYGERGLNLQMSSRTILRPFGGLQYVYARQNGFTETGAGVTNLIVDGNDTHSLRSLLGSELEFGARPLRNMRITPQLRAIYMHEFLDTNTLVNSQFAGVGGSGFATTGLDMGRDWGIVGAGLASQVSDRWSLSSDYNTQFNDRQVYHVGSGTVSYVW